MIERGRIEELVVQELDEANEKYPLFHSPHEAWAVLAEEVDEMYFEAQCIRAELERMWQDVKADRDIEEVAKRIYDHAIFAAQESIQVAAMCNKIKQSELY
jgi:hypothetical protein